MTSARLPAQDLLALVRRFRDERDWSRFHSSKDLALSLTLEAAELLECFQWSGTDLEVSEKSEAIEREMADVFIYLTMLADLRRVDLDRAVREKLAAAEKKYPVSVVKGSLEATRRIHEAGRKIQLREAEVSETKVASFTPSSSSVAVTKENVENVAVSDTILSIPERDDRVLENVTQESLREALVALRRHLQTDPAGFWEASVDDRVAYVRYAVVVLDVWRLAQSHLGPPPRRRPPLDPHLYDWEDMTPGLAWTAFSDLVQLERIETGAFLRAANSGLVGKLLDHVLALPWTDDFLSGKGSGRGVR